MKCQVLRMQVEEANMTYQTPTKVGVGYVTVICPSNHTLRAKEMEGNTFLQNLICPNCNVQWKVQTAGLEQLEELR
jgi:hypothetical protein